MRHNATLKAAVIWYKAMHKRLDMIDEQSSWWFFAPFWKRKISYWLNNFIAGKHQFEPMMQYKFTDEVIRVWSYLDRLIMHLLLKHIKPIFKHIISPLCLHLAGPSAIKGATARIKAALGSGRYHYVIRADIKSYYSSINHKILLGQIKQHFDDPLVLKYLHDIITIAVDYGGQVFLPTDGIPTQSSLSPFFGALYLSALDQAFTNRKGIFYLRYMDDCIILIESKRQYAKARKRLFSVLKDLRLKISPHKTRMGILQKGFHFLGVNFEVTRILQSKIQVKTEVHKRTSCRAYDRLKALCVYAVDPAQKQRYLMRWATWWHHAVGLKVEDLIYKWICANAGGYPAAVWVGAECFWHLVSTSSAAAKSKY